jgi:Synergist-CTERM protein sorting domain-containing protein
MGSDGGYSEEADAGPIHSDEDPDSGGGCSAAPGLAALLVLLLVPLARRRRDTRPLP